MVVCGLVYRTPMPVQPMKAAGVISTTQAAQTLVITPAMVCGARLVTGLVWLVLGLTATARYVANLVSHSVVKSKRTGFSVHTRSRPRCGQSAV
jgi:hypothetical protein